MARDNKEAKTGKIGDLVEGYLRWLEVERNLSPNTIYQYRRDLLMLGEHARGLKRPVQQLTSSDLSNFIESLKRRRKYQPRTQARKVEAIRCFYKWLVREEILDRSPAEKLETPKLPKALPLALTQEEQERIFTHTQSLAYGLRGKRDHCLFHFLFYLGLGLWIGANFLYAVALRRCGSISDVHTLALGYLVLELLLLTFCVHFLGGVEWIGVLFYGLIVGDASLVLPTRRIYLVVTLAVLLFGSLAFAEYGGLIPHRPFFLPGLTLYQDLTWVTLTVLSSAGALAYMAYVFSRLTSALRQRKEALRMAYMQKARELELARSVQAKFLKEPPDIPGLDIAAVNLPAAEVSGDFFCFMEAGKGRHLLAVGDVAGHGVPAALTMSATMMAIELFLQSLSTNGRGANGSAILSGLAREVDQFLTRRIGGESFVTAFFALYDERDASLITLDLGHSHALAYIAASGKAAPPRWAGARQLPLMASQYVPTGRANGRALLPWPLRVEPGDALVLFTDGLIEARRGREEYGIKRLREKVAELGARPSVEIVQGILESVTTFTSSGTQKDDVTLVVVKRSVS